MLKFEQINTGALAGYIVAEKNGIRFVIYESLSARYEHVYYLSSQRLSDKKLLSDEQKPMSFKDCVAKAERILKENS